MNQPVVGVPQMLPAQFTVIVWTNVFTLPQESIALFVRTMIFGQEPFVLAPTNVVATTLDNPPSQT